LACSSFSGYPRTDVHTGFKRLKYPSKPAMHSRSSD
jgi:hypothetical protein